MVNSQSRYLATPLVAATQYHSITRATPKIVCVGTKVQKLHGGYLRSPASSQSDIQPARNIIMLTIKSSHLKLRRDLSPNANDPCGASALPAGRNPPQTLPSRVRSSKRPGCITGTGTTIAFGQRARSRKTLPTRGTEATRTPSSRGHSRRPCVGMIAQADGHGKFVARGPHKH